MEVSDPRDPCDLDSLGSLDSEWRESGVHFLSDSSSDQWMPLDGSEPPNQSDDESDGGFVAVAATLSLILEPELLRGTPLHVALSGFGKHWAGLSSGATGALYQLSQPVESIDVFLSHDWETSRWMKLWALLLCFNSKAAALASLLWSICVGVVKAQLGENVLKSSVWTFSSYLVFLTVLCFWQRIRLCFCSPWMIFLDKLCIHQENDELKQKGILGLGAFVRKSDKLLVLWSKRTFRRLWCAYEIACFLSRSRPVDQIEILPVTMAASVGLSAVLWHFMIFIYILAAVQLRGAHGYDAQSRRPADFAYVSVTCLPIASAILVLVNYLGISMMDDIEQFPQQLQNFRIQESQCYCCTNNHRNPLTGDMMICDRELVYQSLNDLYPYCDSDPLGKFNSKVQETLGPQILRKLRVHVEVKYLTSVVLVSGLPLLFELIGDITRGPQPPLQGFDYAGWCAGRIAEFLQVHSAMIFCHALSMRLWRLRKIPFFKTRKTCLSICLSPIIGIAVGCFWACPALIRAVSADNSLLPLLPFILGLVVNFLLYYFWPSDTCWCRWK